MTRGCILFFARRTDDGRVWCERCMKHVSLVTSADGHHVVDVDCHRAQPSPGSSEL
jgi:hypothetical protein